MFLENWKEYLLKNIFRLKKPEDFGYLYEEFISQDVAFRKAGGVYYTPQYIVDYIVENTLGIQIKGKNPSEITLIKIIDPSCGSGSFLLGAYQYLLNYHLEYYTKEKEKNGFSNALNANNTLKTAIKKQILVNNIFGIDIDTQAVEVSKLSLLIKCMEGETAATVLDTNLILKESVLPSLEENIFAGNSLIASDFYDGGLFLTKKEERKINVFDWKQSFKNIFKNGGFDIAIGNPPYVKQSLLDKNSLHYYLQKYTLSEDLYTLFIEKMMTILKENALLGLIIPSLFIKGVQFEKLRIFINKNAQNFQYKEYGDDVFQEVKMPTCVIKLQKGENENINYFESKSNIYFSKIKMINLGEISTIKRGLEIGRDKLNKKGKLICITGGNMDSYLIKSKNYITKQVYEAFKKTDDLFISPKLLIRETGNKFFVTLDNNNSITTRSIYNLKIKDDFYNLYFILGVLNSVLLQYYFKENIMPKTNIFPKIRIIQLQEVPIPLLDFSVENHKNMYDKITFFAEQLLDLYQRKSEAKTPNDIEQLQRRITHAENQINELVFDLYALTSEEKEIILGE